MPFVPLSYDLAQPLPPLVAGAPLVERGETLQSFEAELFYLLGGRDDILVNRLRRWINWGYIDVATSLHIEELKDSFVLETVPEQPLYRRPLQVFSTVGAAVLDEGHTRGGHPLGKTDLSSFRLADPANGRPEYYFRSGRLLVFYPTPTAAWSISVDYWVRPDPMKEDNDSPVLDLEWHEVILLAAKEKAFAALMEPQLAMAARNEWISMVRRKKESAADEDEGKLARLAPVRAPRQLRGRLSSRYEP